MKKEIETVKLITSVEKDGKVVGLYFEKELPLMEYLYRKYGKENVHTKEIKLKSYITVFSDKELRRRINRRLDKHNGIPQSEDDNSE